MLLIRSSNAIDLRYGEGTVVELLIENLVGLLGLWDEDVSQTHPSLKCSLASYPSLVVQSLHC